MSMSAGNAAAGEVVAITWFLHNACTSNVQLGSVSNVCRRWRDVALGAVASEALAPASKRAGGGRDATKPTGVGAGTDPSPSSIRGLLITDMARELVVRQRRHEQNQSRAGTKTAGMQTVQGDTDGNFCLAWFPPSGIQTISLPHKYDEDAEEDGFQFGFRGKSGTTDDASMRHQSRRGANVNAGRNVVTCCSEWRGYRHATEILTPFGYSTSFIRSVFEKSTELPSGTVPTEPATESSSTASAPPFKKSKATKSHQYNPTFSVRGATLARPEGYCLCVDDDYIEHANSSAFEKPRHASDHRVPSCVDGWMNGRDERDRRPSRGNPGLSPVQRKRKQNGLAGSLLPRVVLSTRRKYPLLHRFAEHDAGEGAERRPLPWERRQRAVQFLNRDRSQAIKLITPRFECGPARGPVTMFVVGVTTEDGCFVSGRSARFEFGHIHPLSSRDMQYDMSPVSIATGKKEMREGTDSMANCAAREHHSSVASRAASSDDDDDSSDSEQSMHCLCNFDSGDPFNPKDISIEDPREDCIHRGCTGPGLWHCYCAVFDGQESIIRVDGCQEPKRTREHYGLTTSYVHDDDNPVNSGRFVGSGVLDGLSIGSDHQFDMSLCYGEIEGDCGQGAIAELAVFKGRMDDSDIEKLEQYLMTKHGILSVTETKAFVAKQNSTRAKPLKIECHLKEDEWRKQAHALIEQRRPWNLEGRVPLRVLANHPSVAWHRTNDITGSPVRISRIGAKSTNGCDSPW